MDEHRIERRKRVADALEDVIEIAKINDVGPKSFSDLLMSLAAALYRKSGCTKEVFVDMASKAYDHNSGAAKIDPPLKH